ncbi:hypothetical protein [Streptomyces sp. NPDC017529]|uniref:hypothetical protein n=1 Tax=Streptomyces sp. NPDC017529 TaxID=3365000 RepID=UPI0037A7DE7C
MQPSDEALDAALAAPLRAPAHSTRLGGRELGPQVQSWKVERAYNTDLPESMRAFSGSASAQLELQLGGAGGVPGPRLYSAWAPRATGDVVRPGQSAVHRAGVTGRLLPAFRGTVRSREAASGTDTVTVQCLDGAERLRGPAALPRPYHGFYWKRPVASGTWCVDELLRQAGIHTCPPPRAPEFDPDVDPDDTKPLTVLYASLHGGFNASYGQPESFPLPSEYDWVREGAPFELALMPKATGLTASWMPRSRFTVPGRVFQVECWVNTALARGNRFELKAILDRSAGALGHISCVFDTGTGNVTVISGKINGPGQSLQWTFPKLAALKGVWHFGFMVDTTSAGATVAPVVQPRLTSPDGSYHVGGKGTFGGADGVHPRSELNRVDLITDMAVECLQVTDRVWADTASYPPEEWEQRGKWSKGAVLDDVVLPLISVPKVSGSQWDVISEIAKASMSTAEFDEYGVFRWHNPSRFQSAPVRPDLTVSSTREIAALTVTEEIDACRNYCEQPYEDWGGIGAAVGTTVTDTAVRRIDPGKSVEVAYAMAEDEADVGPPVTDDDVVPIDGGARVRFGTAASGGSAVKGSVSVACRRVGASFIVRFTNRGTAPVWTATKAGKPSVYIETLKPAKDPKQRKVARWNSVSQRHYGKQELLAPASEWVQSSAAASALSQVMLAAGRYPVPLLGEVEVLHDPRVQLGDVVRVVDSAGASLQTLAWVVGIRTTCTAGAAPQQVLTLRGAAFNGVPEDTGLTPDPPVDPAYGRRRRYAAVTAAYPTLADLTTAKATYRDLLEIKEVPQ